MNHDEHAKKHGRHAVIMAWSWPCFAMIIARSCHCSHIFPTRDKKRLDKMIVSNLSLFGFFFIGINATYFSRKPVLIENLALYLVFSISIWIDLRSKTHQNLQIVCFLDVWNYTNLNELRSSNAFQTRIYHCYSFTEHFIEWWMVQ